MTEAPVRKVMYIRDPVHGNLRLSPLQEELLKTVEVQRLSFIHQLGTTFQSYPGAHGMRLSHAIGVSFLADRIGRQVLGQVPGLSEEERERMLLILQAAGMLHDIGHTPWSHTLEPITVELTGGDHMEFVADMVTGRRQMRIRGTGLIPSILRSHAIEPDEVADLICSRYGGPRYLQQMIFGEVDADMLDYLQRDFYFTGVAFGHIEMDRIITTMTVRHDAIVFQRKGLEAIRDFLFARMQMYSSVYLHRKTRIVDQMLLAAARRSVVELGESPDFAGFTDDELLSAMVTSSRDPWVREMSWRVKYRQKLFTQVFRIDAATLDESDESFMNAVRSEGRTTRETASMLAGRIATLSGQDPGYILVDLPLEALKVSEERFERLDIRFLDDDGSVVRLEQIDPAFTEYMSKTFPNRNYLTVSCCPDIRDKVAEACEALFQRAAMPLFPLDG
jgi:uncharacterized protein